MLNLERFVLLGLGLIALLATTTAQAANPRYEIYEYRDKLPELSAVSGTPGFAQIPATPEATFEHLKKTIRLQIYPGILRGVRGTLTANAGNSADQALLLAYALKSRGATSEQVRIVSATLGAAELDKLLARFDADQAATLKELQAGNDNTTGPELELRKQILSRLETALGADLALLKPLLGDEDARAKLNLIALRAQLRTEAATHFWVQLSRNGQWLDLDAAASLPWGQALLKPEHAYEPEKLPRELFHEIELKLDVTFQDQGQHLTESYLTLVSDSASLAGTPVALFHPAKGDSFYGAGGFAARLGTAFGSSEGGIAHIPVFRVAGKVLEGAVLKHADWVGGGLFGGCGFFGCKPAIVSEILKLSVRSPGAPALTIERPIFDRAGPGQRRRDGAWHLADLRDHGDLPPELQRMFVYSVDTGSLSDDAVKAAYQQVNNDGVILEDQGSIAGDFSVFEEGLRALHNGGRLAGYVAAPNITSFFVAMSRGNPLPNDGILPARSPETSTSVALDLTLHRLRLASSGDTAASGVLAYLAEQLYVEYLNSKTPETDAPLFTVHNVFDRAVRDQVPLTAAHSAADLAAAGLPADVQATLAPELSRSDVLVPARGVSVFGKAHFGWLFVDRADGFVHDGTDVFANQAATEYGEQEESSVSQVETVCQFKQCLQAMKAAATGVLNVVRGRVSSTVNNAIDFIGNGGNCKSLILKVKLPKAWKSHAGARGKTAGYDKAAGNGGLTTPSNEAYEQARGLSPSALKGGQSAGTNMQWDHTVGLGCGGRHIETNISALDAAINGSFGASLERSCRSLCEGTKISGFIWEFVL